MNNYKVYKHTSPSGKVYIGITKRKPSERWHNGLGYGTRNRIAKAIQKYGWDNFTHEILFENLSKEEACQKEIELIAKYKSNNSEFGYNITAGGEGSTDYKHTKEALNKISECAKNRDYSYLIGRKLSLETRAKISKTQTGRKLSLETRNKISEGNKGIKNGFYGRHHTKETKLKNSLAHLGKKHSIETKEKLSKNFKNRKWINNGVQNKFVKLDELEYYLSNGFILGIIKSVKEQK